MAPVRPAIHPPIRGRRLCGSAWQQAKRPRTESELGGTGPATLPPSLVRTRFGVSPPVPRRTARAEKHRSLPALASWWWWPPSSATIPVRCPSCAALQPAAPQQARQPAATASRRARAPEPRSARAARPSPPHVVRSTASSAPPGGRFRQRARRGRTHARTAAIRHGAPCARSLRCRESACPRCGQRTTVV